VIRDYLRAKVVKLLSRVILLVNGAIDAMYIMYNGAIEKKRGGRRPLRPGGGRAPPLPVYGMLFSQIEAKR